MKILNLCLVYDLVVKQKVFLRSFYYSNTIAQQNWVEFKVSDLTH